MLAGAGRLDGWHGLMQLYDMNISLKCKITSEVRNACIIGKYVAYRSKRVRCALDGGKYSKLVPTRAEILGFMDGECTGGGCAQVVLDLAGPMDVAL